MSLPTLAGAATLRPTLVAMVAIFSLLVLGFFLLLSDRLLQDPDTDWHILIGRQILARGALPTVDEVSHSFAGAPWIAKAWLSQVALSLAFDLGGWRIGMRSRRCICGRRNAAGCRRSANGRSDPCHTP